MKDELVPVVVPFHVSLVFCQWGCSQNCCFISGKSLNKKVYLFKEDFKIIRTLNSRNFGRLTDMLNNTRNVEQMANVGVDRRGYRMARCLSRAMMMTPQMEPVMVICCAKNICLQKMIPSVFLPLQDEYTASHTSTIRAGHTGREDQCQGGTQGQSIVWKMWKKSK